MPDNKLDNLENKSSGRHGGARPNSGRPKGAISKANRDVKESKKLFIQRITKHVDELFNAQLSLAKGEQVLMVAITTGEGKNKKRTHEIVKDEETIKQYLDWEEGFEDSENPGDDNHYYYLTTRPANNMAIDSLLNRAYGKATEKVEFEGGFFKDTELTIKVIKADHGTDESERQAGAGVESS